MLAPPRTRGWSRVWVAGEVAGGAVSWLGLIGGFCEGFGLRGWFFWAFWGMGAGFEVADYNITD